jgi:hypothetical protein
MQIRIHGGKDARQPRVSKGRSGAARGRWAMVCAVHLCTAAVVSLTRSHSALPWRIQCSQPWRANLPWYSNVHLHLLTSQVRLWGDDVLTS